MLRKSPAREGALTAVGRSPTDGAAKAAATTFEFSGADRLVGLGFRHWMLGYQTGEIACWEQAWREFSTALGPAPAREAVGDLACWVRTIARLTRRPIAVFPDGCRRFCRDECMAVSMVAASQHDVCPALRACAFALIERSDVDEVVAESAVLADRLKGFGQLLSTASIANAAALPVASPSAAHH